ncbi:Threonylcarbamoyl-AMP synthase [Candidatus Kinetoplastibacterium sorsogonicusi]|uniref:Threonylcarbamoyl-AMP synthase n=1 Tax=Candidatus Kinetoplastidibacterium kentomonadis TaxID=1576550 RepID=A0A3S7J9C7_9PROT|nr:L-threonylcarbamoyladenylate synthase [Candidatus Kinetoplastibacterium sorsogonicusi]AWD32271.1 Threonylcarbamoyl-AMP synthase [Candidatus Kinetoplastibacterium sorsogonicusi]
MKIFSNKQIDHAARYLLEGGLVAFPTETVYGLGANAQKEESVINLYKIKERPLNHPMIVHISKKEDIYYWIESLPKEADVLIENFWPGPLTLILKKSKYINNIISAGQSNIGLRCPSHPIAHALLKSFIKMNKGYGGVVAPSANKFGRISPTHSSHVIEEFNLNKDSNILLLNGGDSSIGIESTVLDLSNLNEYGERIPVLLRPGYITIEQISNILNCNISRNNKNNVKYSGMMKSHYAPRTKLKILPYYLLKDMHNNDIHNKNIAIIHFSNLHYNSNSSLTLYKISNNPNEFAKKIYSQLRYIDSIKYDLIIIEEPPKDIYWEAINDRINRAAS